MTLRTALLSLLLCGFCTQLPAKELDLKSVPANAKWVMHIDIDAGLSTTVAKQCQEKCAQSEKHQEKLEKIKAHTGMDPHKDLHSVTMFGTELKPGTGTLILRAKFDQNKLLAMGKKHDTYKSSKIGDHEVHSVTMKHRDHEHAVFGCFYAEDITILSSSEAEMKTAIGLLDGRGKSLDGSKSPLAKKPGKGSVFHMAVTGFVDAPFAKRIPAFLKGNLVSMSMGENNAKSFGQLTMESADAETAQLLKQVAEGAKAMIALQHGGKDPDVQWFLDASRIRVNGSTFTVNFEAGTTELIKRGIEMHKKHRALFEKYRGRHHHKHGDHDHDHGDHKHPPAKKDPGSKKGGEKKPGTSRPGNKKPAKSNPKD